MSRVKTPTILQMEAAECGAASLAIILAHHKRYVPLEKLRIECGVSRDGSNAANIVSTATEQYGMEAYGAQVEDLSDLQNVKLPCILHWKFNHFVVLEGIGKNCYYINDPATGPRTIDAKEFDESFTGVLLICEPNEQFQTGGQPASVLKGLQQRLRKSHYALLFITLVSLCLVIPGVVVPGFSKIFIDDILIAKQQDWFRLLLLGIFITGCIRVLLTWMQQKYLLRLQVHLMLSNTSKFFWHVLHLPVSFFQQRFAGDVSVRIAANDRVAGLISGDITASVVGVISMVFYAIVMFLLSWQLTLIGITVVIINFFLLWAVSRKIADISRQFLQQSGKLAGLEMNALQNIESLKASGTESNFFRSWSGNHAELINSQQRIMAYNQFLMIIPSLLFSLLTVAILGIGSWQVILGHLTLGTLVAFQSLLSSFSAPVMTLLGLGNQIQQIRGDIMRLDDVLQHPQDPRTAVEETPDTTALAGSVSVSGLQFGYSPRDAALIDDFNLQVDIGQRVAIIGKTGSGKSSLIKLLSGLYQPWSGTIRIADTALTNIDSARLAKTIAVVDQDIFLFSGSVKDNLSLWDASCKDDDMWWALEQAGIADEIASRGGLDTQITESGGNFSGGQQQRLEIARALVTRPQILVLDEATSALDPLLEAKIYANLKALDCTLIIIAHRLSAIRDSDNIIVLDKGRIVEQGQHEHLLEHGQYYPSLVKYD